MNVITVIAGAEPLREGLVAQLADETGAAFWRWKQTAKAADIETNLSIPDARAIAARLIGSQPYDVIAQPLATRKKRFLVADMESTMIEQEMLDEIAERIGIGGQVRSITARAMNGELDFRQAIQQRVALLKGQSEQLLLDLAAIITPMPGAELMMQTVKQRGMISWLVSGGFRIYTKLVAEKLGFDRDYGNALIVRNGVLTGEVGEPLLGKAAKLEILQAGLKEFSLTCADTVAIGDGANDVPMLDYVNAHGGLGIAFRAKPSVRERIPHQINHAGLEAVGFLVA